MAYIYDYFYINRFTDDLFSKDQPILLSLSKIRNGVKHETPTHMHSHLELFYFESGNGSFMCNNTIIPIKAHDVLIVNAKNMHVQFSEIDDIPLVYYSFSIDNIRIKGLPDNCINEDAFCHVSFLKEKNELYANISRLIRELKSKLHNFYTKANAIFTEILIDAMRIFQSSGNQVSYNDADLNKKALIEAKNFIETYFYEDITLERILKNTFMGKSYFLHQFKEFMGISPKKYLNIVRVENAKLLLTKTCDSITQIGMQVGFNNSTYFSEIFMQITGMTPRDFRKKTWRQ